MAARTTTKPKSKFRTIAEVQERLGHVPESRILTYPAPGTATVKDLLDTSVTGDRLVELVEGILVEKAMGFREGGLALQIGALIKLFLWQHNIGYAAGADGMIRFKLDLVRMPDVSFIRWDSVENPQEIVNPTGAFLEYPPDLAVEVLIPSNTRKEMAIKLSEYAKAGVKLVWYVDPERKEVDVYPKGSEKRKKTFTLADTLDGGDVLPGFTLPVAKIFEDPRPRGQARQEEAQRKALIRLPISLSDTPQGGGENR
ncbi:Uma2 family endonuclease [Gemmata sp.]|uniref:Uma2 family endonuclease n=1 Tax=Gemmata sp. TaxID=1914242 RepID=UPI003F700DBC